MAEPRKDQAGGQKVTSPDPDTDSMFERTLRRTPAQRLADATRIARFVLRNREKVREAQHG